MWVCVYRVTAYSITYIPYSVLWVKYLSLILYMAGEISLHIDCLCKFLMYVERECEVYNYQLKLCKIGGRGDFGTVHK